MPQPLTDLYTQNPGTVRADPAPQVGPVAVPEIERATAYTPSATSAKATGYKAINREVGTDELADAQLSRITAQDSPLMKRARQEGILSAARRGLQNSSISAGAAQGAMVDRAAPIAQQNAQHLLTQGLANMDATNRATEVSTGRQTDVSVANMQSANQMSAVAAQLQTAVSQGNAEMANQLRMQMAQLQQQAAQFNSGQAQEANLAAAAAENNARQTVIQANAELNRQYLAGTQALDLATIQGQYQTLLAQNQSASSLYESYMNSVAQVQSNSELNPARAAQAVALIQTQLEAGLRLIDSMNGGSPAAPKSQIPATPARPVASTVQTPWGAIQIPAVT